MTAKRAGYILLALGLALRIAFVLRERFVIYSDLLAFDQIGLAMARGDFGDLSKPPLYPMLLGLIYSTIGHSYMVVAFGQVAIAGVTAVLLYRYATTVFDARAGVMTLALFAAYPDLVVYPGMLLSETLFLLLVVAAFVLLAEPEPKPLKAAGAGALIGLSALTRGTTLYFPLFVVAYYLWTATERRSGARLAVAFSVGFACAIAPWAAHNYAGTGRFVPVYADSWSNVWIGNNPDADGTYKEMPARFSGVPLQVRDSLSRHEAIEYATSHPGTTALLALKKASIYWSPKPDIAAAEYMAQAVGTRAAYVALAAAFVLLYLVAAFGMARVRDWRPHVPALLLAAYMTAIHMASHVGMRYRLPLVPFLMVFAAFALVEWRAHGRDVLRSGTRWTVFAVLTAFLVANGALLVAERAETIRSVLQ